jgi:hypothetical protein
MDIKQNSTLNNIAEKMLDLTEPSFKKSPVGLDEMEADRFSNIITTEELKANQI